MADQKISQLPDGETLGATDVLPIVRGGINYKVTLPQSVKQDAEPVYNKMKLGAETEQLSFGTTYSYTFTMVTQTGAHTFTLPNANSNPIQPMNAAVDSNYLQYIDGFGIQHYKQISYNELLDRPQNLTIRSAKVVNSSTYNMILTDNILISNAATGGQSFTLLNPVNFVQSVIIVNNGDYDIEILDYQNTLLATLASGSVATIIPYLITETNTYGLLIQFSEVGV